MRKLKDLLSGGTGKSGKSVDTQSGSSSWMSWWLTDEPEPGCFPSLSYGKRIAGFVTCLLLGILLCSTSTFFLVLPRTFAKWYSIGSVLLVGSTLFLVGPVQQVKNMFQPGRWLATTTYCMSLFGTLYAALSLKSTGLTLFMILLQFAFCHLLRSKLDSFCSSCSMWCCTKDSSNMKCWFFFKV